MIITIGGSVGSGKTTLAERIAKKYRMKHYSVGTLMRAMADEHKMSLLEFSKYAESHPDVDKEIDRRQKKLAAGNCVFDGRLSAYLLPADLRIWVDASLDVRAKRVARREGIPEKAARLHILRREKSERKRYKKIYKIDLEERGIYDLVIKNDRFGAEDTADIVSAALKVFNVV